MQTIISIPKIRDLGAWAPSDTPDIGEKTVVEKMLGHAPEAAPSAPKVKEPKVSVPKETKPTKLKEPKPEKAPKAPKQIGEGKGGWGVNPKNYGKGLQVESFYNGSTYVVDHDELVDHINASLREKGKEDLFQKPRPFSSSSGLRSGVNWRIKE